LEKLYRREVQRLCYREGGKCLNKLYHNVERRLSRPLHRAMACTSVHGILHSNLPP
jgi:hypothetical protein